MFVGGSDHGWLLGMKSSQAQLKQLGVDSTLTVYRGEGHVMDSVKGDGFAKLLEGLRRSMSGT